MHFINHVATIWQKWYITAIKAVKYKKAKIQLSWLTTIRFNYDYKKNNIELLIGCGNCIVIKLFSSDEICLLINVNAWFPFVNRFKPE